jgi:hypothetical protein
MHCDIPKHECFPANGLCNATYRCPDYDGLLPPTFAIACESPATGLAGTCRLHSSRPEVSLDPGVRDIAVDFPEDGHVFAPDDEVKFEYKTNQAHFLIVSTSVPDSIGGALESAVFGAALPASTTAKRSVKWSDGFAIEEGNWTRKPPANYRGQDLFAFVVAVDGSEIPLAATAKPPRFRVGQGWLTPGKSCTDDPTTGGCSNPTLIMACIPTSAGEKACAVLCLRDEDCTLPDTFCDFDAELPHCVSGN